MKGPIRAAAVGGNKEGVALGGSVIRAFKRSEDFDLL